MKKPISITLDENLINYIKELCEINGCSRSFIIASILRKYEKEDIEDGKNSKVII